MIINPLTSSMVPNLNAIYSAAVGFIPVLFMLRLRIKMRKDKASSPYAVAACDGDEARYDPSMDDSCSAIVVTLARDWRAIVLIGRRR